MNIYFSCPGAYFNLVSSIRDVLAERTEVTRQDNTEEADEANEPDEAMEEGDVAVPPCGNDEDPIGLTAEQIIGNV